MKIDPRFVQESGPGIFTGNELLVKGALEAEGGVHLLTGYPGSPVAGFFDACEAIGPLLNDKGVVAKIASNEALGVAMVNGAQMAGCRAIAAMKSVGVHVASDALALGVLAGTTTLNGQQSGGLIVMGDDPWSDSTQVPADSRFLAEHCRLPVIEPSCPQEIKDWVDLAFKVGAAGGIYIGYLMTVSMADGGGSVECRPNHYPAVSAKQRRALDYVKDVEPNLERSVLLPPRTWHREMQLEEQFTKVKAAARKLGLNKILHEPHKGERAPMGFIASGVAFAYLQHALTDMGLAGKFPILKLGVSYPVDETLVKRFARRCDQVFVIEERRPFVERQVLDILESARQGADGDPLEVKVYGKRFPGDHAGIPATRGLSPSLLMERLIPVIRDHPTLPVELTNGRLTDKLKRMQETAGYEVSVPVRTPAFCPGCPHRDSSSALLELRDDLLDAEYMLAQHKRKPVDLVAHGDTGCYTMLMFEPNKPLMQNYSGMGLGGATGAGVDPFIDNKQIVFMGDGTFFHSGTSAIAQSIYNGQDITYIILENKTTAMTGHQVHAGVEHDLTGNPANALDIERVVKGMVPRGMKDKVRVVRTDPADRDRYRQLLEQTILADGVKVIIADKECGITRQRRVKRAERKEEKEKGFLPRKTYMNVASEVCEYCLECTNQTGCPGLKVEDTDYGPKVQTDLSWCVNDGACHRIHACPSFEEVTVVRRGRQRMGDEHVALDDIPAPETPIHAGQDIWRAYLAGVGGMGIGLCTAILVTAGHQMGYAVQFLDKKGLAIRNGGVYSQLVYSRSDQGGKPSNGSKDAASDSSAVGATTPVIPYGQADLLIGVDILEATRALDPTHPYRIASPQKTAAVLNTAKTETIRSLMGTEDFDTAELEDTLARYTHPDRFLAFNVGDLCERMLDSKLYANIMMLGVAFQRGFLPLTEQVLEKSIRQITGGAADRNIRAFRIGRRIAVDPDQFVVDQPRRWESSRQCLRRKVNTLEAWLELNPVRRVFRKGKSQAVARQFKVLMRQTFRQTRGLIVDDQLMRDVIIRAYDCVVWGGPTQGIDYAKAYCDRLVAAFHKDHPRFDHAVTRAIVWNLAKVMLIKDEPYVSALLTSPEKYKRDRRRFNVNEARGDKIVYRHHNRPEFDVLGRRVRFEWKSKDWQLRLMSGCRGLRKWLPGWHQRERDFRDWYTELVDTLPADVSNQPREYRRWLEVLSVPAAVTGYREVRYPKQDAARKQAEALLKEDADAFEPYGEKGSEPEVVVNVKLPVMRQA